MVGFIGPKGGCWGIQGWGQGQYQRGVVDIVGGGCRVWICGLVRRDGDEAAEIM